MDTRVETLLFRPPFDWAGLTEFFGPRAIPGVEMVHHHVLRRSLRWNDSAGLIEVQAGILENSLELRLTGPATFLDSASQIAALASRVLDLDSDPLPMQRCFDSDLVLAPLILRWPGVRLPGAWDRFEMGVRAILGQQVSVKAAHTFAARLVEKFGHNFTSTSPGVTKLFPLAAELALLPIQELASIGIPQKRAETLHHFAVWCTHPHDHRPHLIELPGIGPWTENYLRMRGDSDRDAFPAGDLGIQKALGIQGLGPTRASREAELKSAAWRPWRAYAVMLLWRSLSLPQADPKAKA